MDEQLPRDVVARGQQQGRPVDAVKAQDVLAEEVPRLRPETRNEVLAGACVTERAQVVDERVGPDVGDLIRVPRDRDAPRLSGATDREVAQAARDEAPCLVGAEIRPHEVRSFVVEREEPVLVGGQPEEPVALLDPLRLGVVLGALAVDELVLGLERLASDAVEPGIDVLVDVVAPVAPDALEELLDEALVTLVARPDEEVVRDAEAGGERPPRLDDPVGVLLRLEALLGRHTRDLRRMLVDAGEKERLTAPLPLVACKDVGRHRCVGVADVRRRVDVVDRRRDVVPLHPHRFYGRPSATPPPRAIRRGPRVPGLLGASPCCSSGRDGAPAAAHRWRAPRSARRQSVCGLPASPSSMQPMPRSAPSARASPRSPPPQPSRRGTARQTRRSQGLTRPLQARSAAARRLAWPHERRWTASTAALSRTRLRHAVATALAPAARPLSPARGDRPAGVAEEAVGGTRVGACTGCRVRPTPARRFTASATVACALSPRPEARPQRCTVGAGAAAREGVGGGPALAAAAEEADAGDGGRRGRRRRRAAEPPAAPPTPGRPRPTAAAGGRSRRRSRGRRGRRRGRRGRRRRRNRPSAPGAGRADRRSPRPAPRYGSRGGRSERHARRLRSTPSSRPTRLPSTESPFATPIDAEVEQRHGVPVRGQDRDAPPVRRHRPGERDGAGRGGPYRRAVCPGDVDPPVLAGRIRVRAERERAEHGAVRRPRPGASGAAQSERREPRRAEHEETVHKTPPSFSARATRQCEG